MAESTPLEELETGKKSSHCRYFKAKVLNTHHKEEINETIQKAIDEQSIVFTDQSTSYVDIADFVELHITEKSDKQTTKETLKWVHITISNDKRNLLGNYHKIKRKYLQLYLNEFVYKLNRRYFEDNLFDRLVIANIIGLWVITDNQIKNKYNQKIKLKLDSYGEDNGEDEPTTYIELDASDAFICKGEFIDIYLKQKKMKKNMPN